MLDIILESSVAPTASNDTNTGWRNREAWLNRAAGVLLAYCAERGYPTPHRPYISVGFPKGSRPNTIGQCWSGERSADGHGHIFIHPGLNDATEVLAVLLHELGHDIVGCEHGHRKPFSQFCSAMGLEKPWTATTPGPNLSPVLHRMAESLGEYPHAALDSSAKSKPKRKRRDHVHECDGCGRKITSYGNDPLFATHTLDDGSECGTFTEVEREEDDNEDE